MRRALLIMAKRPFSGVTKTRLTPPFSADQAAKLYGCFLQDMLILTRAVPNIHRFVAYTPREEEAYFKNIAPDFGTIAQGDGTLGERLDRVLTQSLLAGFDQVLAMNSDSPTLPSDYLHQGFDILDNESIDVVLGPCDDGGYYLIGWKQPHPQLVREVEMSTPFVMRDTLTIAKENNLRTSLLPGWYDVDSKNELSRLQRDLQRNPNIAPHTRAFLWENGLFVNRKT